MKHTTWLLLGFLGWTLHVFAATSSNLSVDARREAIIRNIDEELMEVTRLSKIKKGADPMLLLRMAELLLEKARLLRDYENNLFLQVPTAKRAKVPKSKYFVRSSNYFQQAQKTANVIIRNYPKFKYPGDVYYILAYNAKEFQQPKMAREFFEKAKASNVSDPKIRQKTLLALADIYFNDNEFAAAVPLYKSALSGKKDRWWTKDAYNLSWCYFRSRQYEEAINLMQQVNQLSKDPAFVDMSDVVDRDLAYFYAESGDFKEAKNYFQKSGGNVVDNFIKLAKHLLDQAKFTAAENILQEAQNSGPNEKQQVEINVILLGLYEKFGKDEKHLDVALKLNQAKNAGQLDKDSLEILTYQVSRSSAILQKQVAGNTYEQQNSIRQKKAQMAVSYFKVLANLDAKKSSESMFFAGETFLAAGMPEQSLEYYQQAFNQAKEAGKGKNNQDLMRKALEGITASLAAPNISEATKEKYLIETYLAHLTLNPKSPKSDKIYQRLFTIYMEEKNLEQAEKILLNYRQNFPGQYSTQEAMLAKIMDYYKDKNDRGQIRRWVQAINEGKFKVSASYAKQVRLLLLSQQFENVEKASNTGNKKYALQGYVEIFKAPESSAEAKKNAAYNIAVLFFELGDAERTASWLDRAVDMMTGDNLLKFETSIMAMMNFLTDVRRFDTSVVLYEKILAKMCQLNGKMKSVMLKNMIVMDLAEDRPNRAASNLEKFSNCKIETSYLQEVKLDILKTLVDLRRWTESLKLIEELGTFQNLQPELIYPMYKVSQAYLDSARRSQAQTLQDKVKFFYENARKAKLAIPLEAHDVYANFRMTELEAEKERLNQMVLSFPEATFNSSLKAKFAQLEVVTAKAVNVLQVGSGVGIVRTYIHLIEAYSKMVEELKNFSPEGVSPEYLESFKKSMLQISAPLVQKIADFRQEAKIKIAKEKILSNDNYWFAVDYQHPIKVEYSYLANGVIMDRGGRK